MEQTAIFWGAFDPPHLWHEAVIQLVFEQTDIDTIILLPSWIRDDKTYNVSEIDRSNMLEIFAKKIKWVQIANTELTEFPEIDAYFKKLLGYSPYQIIWTDLIPDLDTWDPTNNTSQIIPKIFIERNYIAWFDKVENFIYLIPEFKEEIKNLSSTKIRNNIKIWIFDWLHPEVEEYIKQNNLYSN